ncbi:MAG: hypothetical protein H6737_04285 [Alphaproteobacteria bacterium]|nr:hypothetical protein [Alphaproteobacteria bacterium]
MSTRETLVRRPDVPDEDIDDIIEIAARLQDADVDAKPVASVDDVRKVAAELDIDPAYVDRAINQLKAQREEDARREKAEAAEASKTRARFGMAGVALLAALGLGFVGISGVTGIVVLSADARMDEALSAKRHAEKNLETVLDRQAALAPQLVALAGGEARELTAKAAALKAADTIDAKLAASDALGLAMAEALGTLPPADDPSTQMSRANLQHEVSGITNRITVERRRYEEAALAYEEASAGIGAAVARGVGLHG